MTPQEIQTALREIRTDAGAYAYISMHVDGDDRAEPVSIALYPYGLTKDEGYLGVAAATFESALERLRKAWTKQREEFRRKVTRKMALAIIRITDQFGECSDAALRDEFDHAKVRSLGEEACALANTMAGKGPFQITTVRGANAA